MNQRIQKLADKAAENLHKNNGQTWGYNPKFAEEFAKLIVRECIEVVDNRSKKNFHPTSYAGELLHYVSTDLKEHFGVEE